MTIAHDVTTAGVAYAAIGTQTISHVASASARGACVLIEQAGTTADEVSSVTYGGAVMTRLRFDTEATEAGAVYEYWLDGVAGGTQNVAMTTIAATNKQLVVSTMTVSSGSSVAVAGHNTGTSASVINPAWSITGLTAATVLTAFEVIHSGLQTMTTTPGGSWTLISSTDLGAVGRGFARQQVASSGTSLVCGWTAATADDFVGASVAFKETPILPPSPPTVNLGADELIVTFPATLPSASTSLSLYENGVKIAGAQPVNAILSIIPRDATVVYSYTVRGDGPGGETPDSTAVVGTPLPSSFTGLTATPGDGQVVLNWNAKSYSGTVNAWLYRDGVQVFSGLSTGTYVDTGLASGSQHLYKISCVVFNPTTRASVFSADVSATTNVIVVAPTRNPNLISDVGGPSFTVQREDMVAFKPIGETVTYPIHHIRQCSTVAWSTAEYTFSGIEFFPPMWFPLLYAAPLTVYLELPGSTGPGKNFSEPAWTFGGMYLADDLYGPGQRVWIYCGQPSTNIMHEVGHFINHIVRPQFSFNPILGEPPVTELAGEVLAVLRALNTASGASTYAAFNADELVAESYKTLIVENADPSWLVIPAGSDATWPAGIRADAWILAICNGDATLAARWRTELTRPELWPAAPWPVHRMMNSQLIVDQHRSSTVIPIQNLDSNEGPTLLLADATRGYREATNSVGASISQWIRSDRPLVVALAGLLIVRAGSPTTEVSNDALLAGATAISFVRLLGGPSEQWRTTVTFRVGELLAVETILWHAIETVNGIETEYAITWNGATVSASLTRRTGAGGTLIDTTKITSGNVLVVGERCTVQAVWGAQGTAIKLRHRTASAVSMTELTSAAMPAGRLAVESWSMPMPHSDNAPTVAYCALAAVSVETIHDGGIGPFTWMDAEYA